eukprot:gene24638-10260_t
MPPESNSGQPQTAVAETYFGKLKQGLKQYGRTGLIVYIGVSFTFTAGFYFAIERHLDVRKIFGLNKDDVEREPQWYDKIPGFGFMAEKGSNLALAMLCAKFCIPIKLPLAMALTPHVHRYQEQVYKRFMKSN